MFSSPAWLEEYLKPFAPQQLGSTSHYGGPNRGVLKHSQILTQLPRSTVQNNWDLNQCSWCQDLQFGLFGPYVDKTPTGLNPKFRVLFYYGGYYWFSLYLPFVFQLNSWAKTLRVLDPHNYKSHRCTLFYTTPAKIIMKIYPLGNKM